MPVMGTRGSPGLRDRLPGSEIDTEDPVDGVGRSFRLSRRLAMRGDVEACIPEGDLRCVSYHPGHLMHVVHARQVGLRPWGWRDGVVESVGPDGWAVVRYLLEDGSVRVWHHTNLSGILACGHLVRLHEQFFALSGPFGWLNVVIRDGLGAVPEPANPELWAQEATVGVVDMSTGRGLDISPRGPAGEEERGQRQ